MNRIAGGSQEEENTDPEAWRYFEPMLQQIPDGDTVEGGILGKTGEVVLGVYRKLEEPALKQMLAMHRAELKLSLIHI